MKNKSVGLVIISNGPGELATWVKPVVQQLKKITSDLKSYENKNYVFKLILVPCPNATGKEFDVATSWNLLDLVIPAKNFWNLLLNPSRYSEWPDKGIVVFLGGDQLWSVFLAKRLGYICITYAEWIARWPQWNHKIAAMNNEVKEKVPKKHQKKCIVIGDLMADIKRNNHYSTEMSDKKWIFKTLFPIVETMAFNCAYRASRSN